MILVDLDTMQVLFKHTSYQVICALANIHSRDFEWYAFNPEIKNSWRQLVFADKLKLYFNLTGQEFPNDFNRVLQLETELTNLTLELKDTEIDDPMEVILLSESIGSDDNKYYTYLNANEGLIERHCLFTNGEVMPLVKTP